MRYEIVSAEGKCSYILEAKLITEALSPVSGTVPKVLLWLLAGARTRCFTSDCKNSLCSQDLPRQGGGKQALEKVGTEKEGGNVIRVTWFQHIHMSPSQLGF